MNANVAPYPLDFVGAAVTKTSGFRFVFFTVVFTIINRT